VFPLIHCWCQIKAYAMKLGLFWRHHTAKHLQQQCMTCLVLSYAERTPARLEMPTAAACAVSKNVIPKRDPREPRTLCYASTLQQTLSTHKLFMC
jgi:hypothetical protein